MGSSNVASALAALTDADKQELARVLLQAVNFGADCTVVNVDLSIARDINNPFELPSFATCYVVSATDANASINLRVNSKAQGVGVIPMTLKDIIGQGYPFAKGFLHWSAQSGKTMTLLLFAHAQFSSGNSVTQVSGGVTIQEGTTVSTRANTALSLSASTAGIVLPADSTRKVETLVNKTGLTLWLGDASVTDDAGANPGIECAPDAQFVWKNTAALYAYCTTAISAPAKIGRILEA